MSRRRARKKKKSLFLPIVIILAVATGLFAARGPWLMYGDQKAKASAMRKEIKSLKESEIKESERSREATNPLEMEEKARKAGWIPPGEIPLK